MGIIKFLQSKLAELEELSGEICYAWKDRKFNIWFVTITNTDFYLNKKELYKSISRECDERKERIVLVGRGSPKLKLLEELNEDENLVLS